MKLISEWALEDGHGGGVRWESWFVSQVARDVARECPRVVVVVGHMSSDGEVRYDKPISRFNWRFRCLNPLIITPRVAHPL